MLVSSHGSYHFVEMSSKLRSTSTGTESLGQLSKAEADADDGGEVAHDDQVADAMRARFSVPRIIARYRYRTLLSTLDRGMSRLFGPV